MDRVKANALEAKLRGKLVDGWTIERLLNHGKSAAVFLAQRGTDKAAVKIFDDDLIQKYGDKTQFARIERELLLVGQHHSNMVRILGGGFDELTKNHFIIMEFVNGPNLAQCLLDVPTDQIGNLIEQLASAARFLDDRKLCHRDIKPENIVITDDYQHLTLLDFGVLRPYGVSGLTDGEHLRAFVGTLQYSSPEFLIREEEDSDQGWRALTFYQIGGVLHDLIMRRPLFSEFTEPFAALVNAVQFQQPPIQNSSVSSSLIELASSCLLKDWRVRLKLVEWDHFFRQHSGDASASSARQRVTNRAALQTAQLAQKEPDATTVPRPRAVLNDAINVLKTAVRAVRADNRIFPPATVSRMPPSSNRLRVRFPASDELAWPRPLLLLFDVVVLEAISRAVEIRAFAYYGETEPQEPTFDGATIFGGVLSTTAVLDEVEKFIYNTIDVIQQTVSDPSERWIGVEGV